MTFDDLVELYDANPVAFLETVINRSRPRRYECVLDDLCGRCLTWGKIVGKPRRVHKKDHSSAANMAFLEAAGFPHRFETRVAFFLVCALSEERLLMHIARQRRKRNDDHADLLALYRREKFVKRGRV